MPATHSTAEHNGTNHEENVCECRSRKDRRKSHCENYYMDRQNGNRNNCKCEYDRNGTCGCHDSDGANSMNSTGRTHADSGSVEINPLFARPKKAQTFPKFTIPQEGSLPEILIFRANYLGDEMPSEARTSGFHH